jgi:hypothetical protein
MITCDETAIQTEDGITDGSVAWYHAQIARGAARMAELADGDFADPVVAAEFSGLAEHLAEIGSELGATLVAGNKPVPGKLRLVWSR